jgi:hypothetical protein
MLGLWAGIFLGIFATVEAMVEGRECSARGCVSADFLGAGLLVVSSSALGGLALRGWRRIDRAWRDGLVETAWRMGARSDLDRHTLAYLGSLRLPRQRMRDAALALGGLAWSALAVATASVAGLGLAPTGMLAAPGVLAAAWAGENRQWWHLEERAAAVGLHRLWWGQAPLPVAPGLLQPLLLWPGWR